MHNQQNDQVYSVTLRDISLDKLAVKWFCNLSRVMGLGRHFEKRQVVLTYYRNECQNQPKLLYRACFGESSVRTSQKFARRLLLFPARFCAIRKNQMHEEVIRRQFAWFFFHQATDFVAGSQPIGPFCLKIHFGQTRLSKKQDFGLDSKSAWPRFGTICHNLFISITWNEKILMKQLAFKFVTGQRLTMSWNGSGEWNLSRSFWFLYDFGKNDNKK
jgi:hypothetical protein